MAIKSEDSELDLDEYVEENRESIVKIIRHSEDPFARACAWALLDRHTPDRDIDELHAELDSIDQRKGES